MPEERKNLLIRLGQWAGAILAIAALLGGSWQLLAQPRLDAYFSRSFEAASRAQAGALADQLAGLQDLTAQIAELTERLDQFEDGRLGVREQAIRFAVSGHSITSGQIGGIVHMSWRFYKDHECGAPIVDAFFLNGVDSIHRFRDVSLLTENGRGINMPADSRLLQTIAYTARVPAGEGVTPGAGVGWVHLEYPDCPFSPPVNGPRVTFQITEAQLR